jgi:hypothetical protein
VKQFIGLLSLTGIANMEYWCYNCWMFSEAWGLHRKIIKYMVWRSPVHSIFLYFKILHAFCKCQTPLIHTLITWSLIAGHTLGADWSTLRGVWQRGGFRIWGKGVGNALGASQLKIDCQFQWIFQFNKFHGQFQRLFANKARGHVPLDAPWVCADMEVLLHKTSSCPEILVCSRPHP